MKKLLLLIAFLSFSAHAEIEKIAIPTEKGISLYWWPKVSPPQGWVQDKESSHRFNFNAFVPVGSNFSDAETVMYASANYKPSMPEIKSFEEFVATDKQRFLSDTPNLRAFADEPFYGKDGSIFVAYKFIPLNKGDWEEVAYGEKGVFYLTFVISSHSRQGVEKNKDAFKAMIASYKR